MPEVKRYPYTSDTDSATWKYKIADPDDAITKEVSGKANFEVLIKKSYDEETGTSKSQPVDAANYADFAELELEGLENNKYYAVNIPYKLLTSDTTPVQKIASIPVLFKAEKNSLDEIEIIGLKKADNSGYEDALINEGGYQYRLTLRGADVTKLAALRVTFEANGKKIVYDPVYLDVQSQPTVDGDKEYPYAYAYMDSAALAGLIGEHKATVSVLGYYSTNVAGVKDYESKVEIGGNKFDLDGENVYALQLINSDGENSYVYQENNVFVGRESDRLSVVKSLFIPGAGNKEAGFSRENNTLSQRYASLPLALLTGTTSKTLNLSFDENGMLDNESSKYVLMERLALSNITFTNRDNEVSLSDILPAVQRVNTSVGVTSVLMNMEVKGTGVSEQTRVYAQILEKAGDEYKSLNVGKDVQQRDEGTEITVYKVEDERYVNDESTYYTKTEYGEKFIPISGDVMDGKMILPLRIQGLTKDTEYRVVLFAYDSEGNRQDLYCIDKKQTGYRYEVKTKDELQIQTSNAVFNYLEYDDKFATFGFAVPGDEGTGMKAYYWVENKSGTTKVIDEKELPRNGSTGYEYYSTDMARNQKMMVSMTPGGKLDLGTDYVLKVEVRSEDSGEVLGNTSVNFTTPSKLEAPSFMVQATPKTNGDTSALSVTVVCTDKNFTVMNDTYTITIKDKDGKEVPGKTVKVPKGGESSVYTTTVVFDNLEQNVTYTVEASAQVDLNNDKQADPDLVSKQITVTTELNASATVSADATADKLTLYLSKLINFESVEKVLVTVYKNGTICYSKECISSDITQSGDSKIIDLSWSEGSWGTKENGEYWIQLQYRDGNGNVLGDDEAEARVKGAVATMFSMRRPSANAVEASSEEISSEETSSEEVSSEETESIETESVETESTETAKETEVQESVEMETPQIDSEDVDTIEEGGDSGLSPASNQEVVQE